MRDGKEEKECEGDRKICINRASATQTPRKIFTEEKDNSNKERIIGIDEQEIKVEEIEQVVILKQEEEEMREDIVKHEEGPRRSRRKNKPPRKSS